MIASDYRDHSFVIDHDGIIRLTISFDDHIIFQGDHYDVEEMLQQSTYCFKELLEQRIKEIITK